MAVIRSIFSRRTSLAARSPRNMLDKLFVRVRSWLHNDPTGVLGDPNLGTRLGSSNGANAGKPGVTPPPLPPDAWAESESGMVITESGIIILDPAAVEA